MIGYYFSSSDDDGINSEFKEVYYEVRYINAKSTLLVTV